MMIFHNPSLTFAIALAVGMICQALAHHLRVPGIVLLLAAGVLFGPDVAGIIHPEALGSALNILTGFAVAVILFEGGLNLKFSRLRKQQRSIRHLILYSGIITAAGGTLTARFILYWPWQTALLFGTLVMVTGPTVINPLLKRLKVKRSVATVLEAEGVLIDAIGAVVATVALEAALSPTQSTPLLWLWHIVSRLGFGMLCGVAAAWILILLFDIRRLIPEGTENVFTLCMVLALFQGANAILSESGIAAVTAAGIVIGNFSARPLDDLLEFKEQLTVMLIGMLFVLLAADVRLEQVRSLGLPGVFTVLVLMLVVRPVAVFAGTHFSDLKWRERLFISWIGPRGIVAAAVASLFAASLTAKGIPGGYQLRALVFLVIAVTVISAGLTGGLVAGMLNLRRPSQDGWVILGANELARGVARLFKEDGQEIICIDSNAEHCQRAQEDCTRVIYGNGIQSRYLQQAEIDTRMGVLALTPNEDINYLFMQRVKAEVKQIQLFCALQIESTSLTPRMFKKIGAEVMFGAPVDVDFWTIRIRQRLVRLQTWRFIGPVSKKEKPDMSMYTGNSWLIAACRRGGVLRPVGDGMRIKPGDEGFFFVVEEESEKAGSLLRRSGWERIIEEDDDFFSPSVCHL